MFKQQNNDELIIPTPSVKRFQRAMSLLMHMPDPMIWAITGGPGYGKTRAVNHYVKQQNPQSHTGFPSCIKIVVPPKPTPRKLTKSILTTMNEKPRGENASELADQVKEILSRHDINLLIFDESNRLNASSFDMLRDIHDQTRRSMVLVGTPDIMRIIERYEQFNSRVAIEIEFRPLELDELISHFLPHLLYSKWKFNPDSAKDQELAEYIWQHTSPSLRRLDNWIIIANAIAELDNVEKISRDTMEEAKILMRLNNSKERDEDGDDSAVVGWQEMVSESRKRAKK